MRFVIGIDLGTTNSCVSYIDSTDPKGAVQLFKIPQIVFEGSLDYLSTLPSFCYLTTPHEWDEKALSLPWKDASNYNNDYFVGSFAAQQGAKTPTRLVQSAKSWLCHAAAVRKDKILPVDAGQGDPRISPVEATARYLSHIRASWNEMIAKGDPEADFDSQDIVLTVPASFDEAARSLTVEAAKQAGFKSMTLLEEPQAAFYSWLNAHEQTWNQILKAGDVVLVCDVGGGTTDFTLIEAVENGGLLSLQRCSVGDHLLLGGDNMDAALAHLIETKLEEKGATVSYLQRSQLLHQARKAKEALLDKSDLFQIVLQGMGSSVIQQTITLDLHKQEVETLLLNGFFSVVSWDEALKLKKTSGMKTMGLPYEDEPSVIKHLANFLSWSGKGKKPSHLLFNGGAMKPQLYREAVINALKLWYPNANIQLLSSYNLDLAVSRGAAYYGKVRLGQGVKIGGGLARGYYLIVEIPGQNTPKALCLLPKGSEEGAVYEPSNTFLALPNTPVSFQLCTSHIRLHDKSGDLVDIVPEEMQQLAPIQTVLRYGAKQSLDKIPVHMHIHLTPIGTLEISLKKIQEDRFWKLEFQVRTAAGQDDSLSMTSKPIKDQAFDYSLLNSAEELVKRVFGLNRGSLKPGKLIEQLEEVFSLPRREWPPSVLRHLADVLIKNSAFRKVSAEYAARWWNLVGFSLRPGFGYPLDDFRIKELWKVILSDYKAIAPQDVAIQQWICYRRIAGGLNKGQQQQLAADLLNGILTKSGRIEINEKGDLYPFTERLRTVASMELLDISQKIKLGNALLARLNTQSSPAEYWALGRLGARQLLHGSIANVVDPETCSRWIYSLLRLPPDEKLAHVICQLARKTAYKNINIISVCIEAVLKHFSDFTLFSLSRVLLQETTLTKQELEFAMGEVLPVGIEFLPDQSNAPL